MFFKVGQNAAEQLDVAVDQVEAAFVGLAAQSRRDDDEIRVGGLLGAAAGDPLIGHERAAVHQIERLAVGQLAVHVDQGDLADHPPGLQREARAGTDESTAADDCHLHCVRALS